MDQTPDPAREGTADIAARHLRLVDPSTGPGAPANFGDMVTLRSGGPITLVVDFDMPGCVIIAWRHGPDVHEATFDRRCLRPLCG